ncbi:MAG: hypothetical protein J7513_06960 [Solirubrobacteraceae bacterium]|nr:hypothetical protein [Solirubrobacteraceae bacterium]
MSQPADPASGVAPADAELALNVAELAMLAHLDGRLPLVLPQLPAQPEEAWFEVLDHVVERGLLLRDGNDLTLLESVAPLLAPIVSCEFALEATVDEARRTWFAVADEHTEEHVIECVAAEDPMIGLNGVAYDGFEARVAEFLGLDGAARGADGVPSPITTDELEAAFEQLSAGKPVEVPTAQAIGDAIAADSLRRIELRWVDDGELVISRYQWADLGPAGLVVLSTDDEGAMSVQPRATTSFREHLASLLP